MPRSVQEQISNLLDATITLGSYPGATLCTEDGLVLASAGAVGNEEGTAAVASLFDAVVERACRDLGFSGVDEVSLLDPERGRTIIRPMIIGDGTVYLVVVVPKRATWRRNTNQLVKQLQPLLEDLMGVTSEA